MNTPVPDSPRALEDFAEFYRHFERLMRGIIYPLVGAADTDDVVQAAFIKCWQKRGDVRDHAALRSWVATVALHQARDHGRRRKSWWPLSELMAAPTPAPTTDAGHVMAALQQLDWQQREVIVLRFFEEKSVGEVAALLGLPEGTVKSRLHHAKAKLKRLLVKAGVFDA